MRLLTNNLVLNVVIVLILVEVLLTISLPFLAGSKKDFCEWRQKNNRERAELDRSAQRRNDILGGLLLLYLTGVI